MDKLVEWKYPKEDDEIIAMVGGDNPTEFVDPPHTIRWRGDWHTRWGKRWVVVDA